MNNKNFNFDSNFKELEKIVKKLENGNENLEENLKLYEKGMNLCESCKKHLQKAKLKIENLNNSSDNNIYNDSNETKEQ